PPALDAEPASPVIPSEESLAAMALIVSVSAENEASSTAFHEVPSHVRMVPWPARTVQIVLLSESSLTTMDSPPTLMSTNCKPLDSDSGGSNKSSVPDELASTYRIVE